jgi:hypothetical protein
MPFPDEVEEGIRENDEVFEVDRVGVKEGVTVGLGVCEVREEVRVDVDVVDDLRLDEVAEEEGVRVLLGFSDTSTQ